ncbi:MAG: cellulose biosynthesis protein BcsG [Herminiimonas sp.]|nr:cellulose biosynthesis protein BcsG [Herminiimonas sp.]
MLTRSAGPPSVAVRAVPGHSAVGGWNVYFVLKLVLLWRGLIDFHPVQNLGFFLLLAVPLPPALRRVRFAAGLPLAVVLLYHDSFLPPIDRLFARAGALADFSVPYAIELIGRFVSGPVVALLAGAFLLLILARRLIRISTLVLAVLVALAVSRLVTPAPLAVSVAAADGGSTGKTGTAAARPRLSDGGSNAELDRILGKFYGDEARRVVRLPTPAASQLPFDLLFIHVCSLSWDDIQAAGLELHPLLKSFDIMFRHFNAAASYSGPAAIRLNRATCGQSSNDGLYKPVAESCYLMPSLKRAGYDINFAMNHDGHFDDFLQTVRQQGVQAAPLTLVGLPAALRAFDDSAIQDDGAVLSRWRTLRATSTAPRTALYYNTISLHDGNRLASVAGGGAMNGLQGYRFRLTRLFDELESLMQALASGSRRTVVVMIPEHGAAVRGDRMQIAGLREIPTPAITTVPVGIRVIDPTATAEHDTEYVDSPTSYLALSQVIARMLEKSPFGPVPFDPKPYVTGLPTTQFVAENQSVVMRIDDRSFWREEKDHWRPVQFDPAR